jgi:chemotaxis protein CheC
MEIKLNSVHLDAVREASSIGAGHAATALYNLAKRKIMIEVPQVGFFTVEEMVEAIGDPEEVETVVLFTLDGEIDGTAMFMLPYRDAIRMLKLFSTEDEAGDFDDEINISLLKEVGNIVVGSCLTGLGDFLKLKVLPSIPMLVVDQAAAILTSTYISFLKEEDSFFLVKTKFEMKDMGDPFFAYLILLPKQGSLKVIIDKLEAIVGKGL